MKMLAITTLIVGLAVGTDGGEMITRDGKDIVVCPGFSLTDNTFCDCNPSMDCVKEPEWCGCERAQAADCCNSGEQSSTNGVKKICPDYCGRSAQSMTWATLCDMVSECSGCSECGAGLGGGNVGATPTDKPTDIPTATPTEQDGGLGGGNPDAEPTNIPTATPTEQDGVEKMCPEQCEIWARTYSWVNACSMYACIDSDCSECKAKTCSADFTGSCANMKIPVDETTECTACDEDECCEGTWPHGYGEVPSECTSLLKTCEAESECADLLKEMSALDHKCYDPDTPWYVNDACEHFVHCYLKNAPNLTIRTDVHKECQPEIEACEKDGDCVAFLAMTWPYDILQCHFSAASWGESNEACQELLYCHFFQDEEGRAPGCEHELAECGTNPSCLTYLDELLAGDDPIGWAAALLSDCLKNPRENGVEACEGHGFNEKDCNLVGCCAWTAGECMSNVGTKTCYAETPDLNKGTQWNEPQVNTKVKVNGKDYPSGKDYPKDEDSKDEESGGVVLAVALVIVGLLGCIAAVVIMMRRMNMICKSKSEVAHHDNMV